MNLRKGARDTMRGLRGFNLTDSQNKLMWLFDYGTAALNNLTFVFNHSAAEKEKRFILSRDAFVRFQSC